MRLPKNGCNIAILSLVCNGYSRWETAQSLFMIKKSGARDGRAKALTRQSVT